MSLKYTLIINFKKLSREPSKNRVKIHTLVKPNYIYYYLIIYYSSIRKVTHAEINSLHGRLVNQVRIELWTYK